MKAKILILPLCVWLLAGFCGGSARGQTSPARSFTGQFTARILPTGVASAAPPKASPAMVAGSRFYALSLKPTSGLGNGDEVTLEPSTLVVSCERLKKVLLEELGLADRWQGRIDLTINPNLPENQGTQLQAVRDGPGWYYKLQLPRRVQEEILMRSLLQALLLEIANRQGGVQSAEIPLWLVEGISANLQANNLPTFIVQPGQNWTSDVRWNKGSQRVPLALRQHAPLTFQQLSWPEPSDLSPEGLPLYRACAQLFVAELLRFNDGRPCLCSMIAQLPLHWNWQTAFLEAFKPHFQQLLDVEKWWSLSFVDYVSDSKAQTWTAEECRRNLQRTLDVPVDVHFGANQMPVEARVTLQEVIRQWPPQDAQNALRRAASELRFMLPRTTPQMQSLVSSYLTTLVNYFKSCQDAGRNLQLGKNAPSLIGFVKSDAIKQLDALDQQREALWPSNVSSNLQPPGAVAQSVANSTGAH